MALVYDYHSILKNFSVRAESEVLKVKVPLICPSTAGVPALREGRYHTNYPIC